MTSATCNPRHDAPTELAEAKRRANAAMLRYARGDDDAFVELYEILSPRLYRLCRHLCGQIDAEELLQEVFLKMHRARTSFEELGGVFAWSFAIARTTHLDRMRYTRRRPEASVDHSFLDTRPANVFDPESMATERCLSDALECHIEQLSDNLRAAFWTVKVKGVSYAEASAALNISVDAVKQRVSRACAELKSLLTGPRLDAV